MDNSHNPNENQSDLANYILGQLSKNIQLIDAEVQELRRQHQELKHEVNVRIVRLEERALIIATVGGTVMGAVANLLLHFLKK